MKTLLSELEKQLQKKYPKSWTKLTPPASKQERARLEAHLDRRLPKDLATLYAWKGGGFEFFKRLSRVKDEGDDICGDDWMSIADVIAKHERLVKLDRESEVKFDDPDDYYSESWLPIGDQSQLGDFLCYALEGSKRFKKGEIVNFYHEGNPIRAARSLEALLEDVLACVKAGKWARGREDVAPPALTAKKLMAKFTAAKGYTPKINQIVEGALKSARKLVEERKFIEARPIAQTVIREVNSGWDIELECATALVDELGERRAQLERSETIGWVKNSAWLRKARWLFDRGELVQALDAVDRALYWDKEEPLLHGYRARVLSALGRDAKPSAERALELLPARAKPEHATLRAEIEAAAHALLGAAVTVESADPLLRSG